MLDYQAQDPMACRLYFTKDNGIEMDNLKATKHILSSNNIPHQ